METLLFYLLVEAISLFFFYLAESKRKIENPKEKAHSIKKSTICLIISFLPLLLLIGLRNIDVGVDTRNYASVFQRIANNTLTVADQNWLGFGYIYLCKAINFIFGNNFTILNLCIGFLTLLFFYKGILDTSENPTMSLYILFSTCLYYQTFNQSRQLLAISIIFYSFKYLLKNDFKKYFIFILLASSIHTSALIMLPFYFLSKLKVNKKSIFIYCLIALGSIVFFQQIIGIISSTSYGLIYQTTEYFKSNKSSLINLLFRLLLLIICYIISIYTKEKLTDDTQKKCFNIAIWCLLFQLLTTKIYILGRITTYFYIIYILLIPNLIKKVEQKNLKKIIKIGVIICFFIYHIIYFKSAASSAGYDLYKFFFQS